MSMNEAQEPIEKYWAEVGFKAGAEAMRAACISMLRGCEKTQRDERRKGLFGAAAILASNLPLPTPESEVADGND